MNQDREYNGKLYNAFEQRYRAMDDEISSFLPHWQEIANFISPRIARIDKVIEPNKGNKVNQRIIDPTASLSVRTLQSGLMAGLTSPSRPWFKIVARDPDLNKRAAVKAWCYQVEMIIRDVFAHSNLYLCLPLVYNDLAMPGTACMYCVEDPVSTVRFYPFQVGTYRIAINDSMRCDTIYRRYAMTAQQIVQKFGIENVSADVKAQWESNRPQTEFEVTHVIEPNDDRVPRMVDAKNKPFRSVYYESASFQGKFLRMSGFDEFPVMGPRWSIYNAQDPYGYSPAMDALGFVKGLQKEQKLKYKALDKYVDPSMVADSSLRNEVINAVPGGVTYVDGLASGQKAGLRRLEQELPDISHLVQDIQDVRMLIKRCFFEDLMQMLAQSDNPEMTAREIEERHAEKVLVLGPVMERMNDELFDPLIDRTFNILLRRGVIPPAPEELQDRPLKVQYTSIMAQAMHLMGIANIEKTCGFVGSMAQMDPKALDKIDTDEAIDTYSEAMGVNPKIIRSADQVKPLRDARMKKQQAEAAAQMAQPVERMAKAGKAMGDTDPEQVKQIMAMMTGQG